MRKILNLSFMFNPEDASPEELWNYKSLTFSGGEPHIKLNELDKDEYREGIDLIITHRINSFNDLGLLMVAVDAANRTGILRSLNLVLPYFPGARQDRVMVDGEPLTVKIYADLINSLGFDQVLVLDPHSDVVGALVQNIVIASNHYFVREAIDEIEEEKGAITYLISPDAGANKKITALAKELHDYGVVKCDKTRNVQDGSITGFEVYADDLNGANCVIVDDICDGGGTFIGLAEALKAKGAGKLYLIVSHGIFSKGFRELNKYFELIYCTDSVFTLDDPEFTLRWDRQFHKVRQLKLRDVL